MGIFDRARDSDSRHERSGGQERNLSGRHHRPARPDNDHGNEPAGGPAADRATSRPEDGTPAQDSEHG